MKNKPKAPRFHALWEHRLGKTIILIPKEEWNSIYFGKNALVEIDLNKTPLKGVAGIEGFITCAACKIPSGTVELHIYRNDPKDNPTPINVDLYDIYEDFPDSFDVTEMVYSADTDFDSNFSSYLEGNIFLIKRNNDDNHWLQSLPDEINVLIEMKS